MPLHLVDLDAETREQMLAELERDLAAGRVYLSPRLAPLGRERFPELLRQAIESGDDRDLARALAGPRMLKRMEIGYNRGRPHSKRVPHDAHVTLAEGEFNRYYIRAVCRSVLAMGGERVLVYRGRGSGSPRPESEALDGVLLDAATLLRDLRTHVGVDTALGVPTPNSGLSVRHPPVLPPR